MSELKRWHCHEGIVLDSLNGFDVIDCDICGFRHIIPIPTHDELENIYRQEYYAVEKPLYIERYLEDQEWWSLVYNERYCIFESVLPTSFRRILDVGSGPGYFLLEGQRRGWLTLGIEPSAKAAAHSREIGLEIIEEFLNEEISSQLGKFDVVHISQVLEHIPNPKNMLQLISDLLNPGGLICVVVPNDYNPFQTALRKECNFEPWWVAPPHHINYFDFNTLIRLMELCDFEIVTYEATFPIDMFLLMGDNYVGYDTLGRQCHQKRKLFERNLAFAGLNDIKRKLYKEFANMGIGREAVVIGRKK